MRSDRAVLLILCLLCAGLIIAACGDDGDPGGATSSKDFIAKADEVCTNTAREALANPQPTATTAENAVPVLEVSIQRREDELAALEDLGEPPSDIAADWDRVIELKERRLANTEETLRLARRGVDPPAPDYQSLVTESSELGDQQEEILKRMGSTSCARVLAPADRKEIVKFTTFWETTPFPGGCEKYTTPDGIKLVFRTVEACEKGQRDLLQNPQDLTKSLRVTDVEGIAEVAATVDATAVGGFNDGVKLRYTVVFEDGRYKMDSVTLQPGEA